MKNTWIFLFACLLALGGCQPDSVYPGNRKRCDDGRCYFAFQENKDLFVRVDTIDQNNNTARFIQVESGDKRMFSYTYVKNDRANVSDDEYSEFLRFLVDPSLDSFILSFPADQASSKAYLQPSCFCQPDVWPIQSGTISGEKINENTWELSVDVGYNDWGGNRTLKLEEKFEKIE